MRNQLALEGLRFKPLTQMEADLLVADPSAIAEVIDSETMRVAVKAWDYLISIVVDINGSLLSQKIEPYPEYGYVHWGRGSGYRWQKRNFAWLHYGNGKAVCGLGSERIWKLKEVLQRFK